MGGRIHMEPMNRPMHEFIYAPERFDLNAPYQRGSVWSDKQRRNLVRSMLWGIPIGAITVAELDWRSSPDKPYRVVDGKQRVETIVGFMDDAFRVPEHWFDDSTPMTDGGPSVYYSELPDEKQALWKRLTVAVVQFDPTREWAGRNDAGEPQWRRRSPEEILEFEAMVYLLINRGGVPHEDSDLTEARALTGEQQ